MTGYRAYLDYNASAPLLPKRAEQCLPRSMRRPILLRCMARGVTCAASSRMRAARSPALVDTKPDHVVFTSGATEAASTLLTPEWRMGRGDIRMSKLYVSAADHPCLLNGGRFPAERVVRVGVDRNGVCDLAALGIALSAHDRAEGLPLVAIHLANNETGVIQPAREIGKIVKDAGGVLVLDAVQAVGRIPLDLSGRSLPTTLLSPRTRSVVPRASVRSLPHPT